MKSFAAFFLFCICLPFAVSRRIEFFRKDYTYIEEFDAFYKLHWDASVSTWKTAFLACDQEGATLFYPKVQDEWVLVKTLTDRMIEAPNVTEILVGLHDEFNLGEFITVDGLSTPYPLSVDGEMQANGNNCITMNIDTGKFSVKSCLFNKSPLPYVCKKVEARAEDSCPTVDQGYKFIKTLKKCYKISEKHETWQEAMKTCFMEGGSLAVIDTDTQAQEIRSIIDIQKSYFVGVRKLLSQGDFYSVRGKKFSEMYQNPNNENDNSRSPNEYGYLPNQYGQYPDENGVYPEYIPPPEKNCGTVRNRGNPYLYTEYKNCNEELPFICEMEV
ncbi:hypothetical protein PYW08_008116 [Mythimna loreyi]|uniref:Uncharacterized protein n=1 Tax=Mythimna loreyi TaxID=667449 RepID=A0ACC2QBM1_9NEOP|nr:hypothetical protein PYW08_008116 [Mythimna loreyi]